MARKGICTKYKAIASAHSFRYLSGQKRCRVCEIFLDWKGLRCPCCRSKL